MNDDSSTQFYPGLQPRWSFQNLGGLHLKLTIPEVSEPNRDQDKPPPPFAVFRSGFSAVFPGCKANDGTVTVKGPWTDFAKEH